MEKTLHTKEYKLLLDQLRLARLSGRMTQVELAQALGETQSFISMCERGERRLDVVELRAWCLAIGVSFPEFIAKFDLSIQKKPQRTARKPHKP